MIKIQIPATSANLGAGFDALGLALNYYNYVNIEEADGIYIESLDGTDVPNDASNLVYDSARILFDICGKPLNGLKIQIMWLMLILKILLIILARNLELTI